MKINQSNCPFYCVIVLFLLFLNPSNSNALLSEYSFNTTDNGTKVYNVDPGLEGPIGAGDTYSSSEYDNSGSLIDDGYYYYNANATYIGTVDGNTSDQTVEEILQWYLNNNDFTISSSEKVEAPDTSNSTLYISYAPTSDSGEFYSGTWSTYSPDWNATNVPQNWLLGQDPEPDDTKPSLQFYAVKGSDSFALFEVDPTRSAGTWNVSRLDKSNANPNGNNGGPFSISHYTGYFVDDGGTGTPDEPEPIPEPATMLLFGTGLIGFGFVVRRKYLNK